MSALTTPSNRINEQKTPAEVPTNIEIEERRQQRGRHKKRCGMSWLIGTFCVVVLLLVGVVVGGNIDGTHTLFAGDHFADRAVLGNYWGTNGDTDMGCVYT